MSQRLVQDGLAVTRPDTSLTEEEVEDIVGGMLTGNTETLITVTYQDGDGTIDFVVDNDLGNYSNTPGWIADITGESLSDLSDVTITSIASGEIIKWNGSAWVNNTLAEAGIAADTHTHTESDITDLDHYDSTDFATDLAAADTDDLSEGATNLYYTDARADARIALAVLDDFADVTITSVGDGEILLYDSGSSDWINQTFAEADIASISDEHLASFLLGGM
jgi:hypothetical protein